MECGWGRKSDAVARIAAELGMATDALAFVDDDPYERAEVGTALPEVLVLAPEEVTDAASWPEFGATAVTDEARRRGEMYAARRRRQDAERAFGGSREEFLASAGTQVTIAAAAAADVPRLHELTARTRQFNSAGRAVAEAEFATLTGTAGVVTVRLRDAFGDDGIVGVCVISYGAGSEWTVRMLAMSCRAMGRGVIGALLTWLIRAAARAGAREVAVPCVLNERNVPLRLALASAGFRAAPGAGTEPVFRRDVGGAVPGLPAWVTAPGEPAGGAPAEAIAGEIRDYLAGLTGRAELAGLPGGRGAVRGRGGPRLADRHAAAARGAPPVWRGRCRRRPEPRRAGHAGHARLVRRRAGTLMPPPGGATSSAPRSPVAADRAAEVWWYDAGEVTLTPADVADLDVRETARAAAFVFPGDRHRYQVAHVMLRQVLASRLGSEPGRLVFTREPCPTCGGPSGKPVLASAPDRAQAPPAPFFSLAHSGTAVAIAVASQPVGVDVEREATGCLCSLVTAMHPGDAAIVEHLPEPERHTAVIRWWVRAEAVLKCAGTGIAHGMDAFPVLGGLERNKASPGSRLPTDSAAPSWAGAAGCSFAALSAPKGYQAAIALPGLRRIRYRWGPGGP